MRSTSKPVLAALLVIMLFAVGRIAGSDDAMNVEKEKTALMAVDSAFSALSAEKGRAAAFAQYMDDSATILRDNAHPFTGRESINSVMARSPGGTLTWKPFFADVSTSGDLGYTIGSWEYSEPDSAGVMNKSLGYYVTIWKKLEIRIRCRHLGS
jgi:ketosteroid isomerase-like protein